MSTFGTTNCDYNQNLSMMTVRKIIIVAIAMSTIIVINPIIVNGQEKCESFDRELAHFMIPHDQIPDYKQTYERVYKAIYSIPPKSRDFFESHEVLDIPLSNIDASIDALMLSVASDLKIDDLNEELSHEIKQRAEFAKLGITENKKRYVNIRLSYEFGGKTHIMVGAIGYKKITDDTIRFGVSLYREAWEEQWGVRLKALLPVVDFCTETF